MSERTLCPKLVKTMFRYEDGRLYWLPRPIEHFNSDGRQASWNRKFSGKLAGYINQQNGRRVIRIQMDGVSSNYLAYRLIWAFHYGVWPSETVDHIDGDQANDRIENLRDVPFQENCKNLAIQANNKSGARGVSWDAAKGMWQARIQESGREIFLGLFHDIEHAKIARKAAERALGFHRNHGRPPRNASSSGAAA